MAGKVQMQGRNTVTQQIVTWLADAPDWAGAESDVPVADVTLYARSRTATSDGVLIVCLIDSPSAGESIPVGYETIITGTISRPGTVAITGVGPATVVGLTWSCAVTPGSIGSRTFTAVATDAVNASTSSTSVSVAVVDFPAGAAMWLDARRPRYSDLAGTVPAAFNAPVRRLDMRVPLGSYASAASDAARPIEERGVLNFHTAHGMSAPCPTSMVLNDLTYAINFSIRDNWYASLLRATSTNCGHLMTVAIVSGRALPVDMIQVSTGVQLPGTSPSYHTTLSGARASAVVRFTPTGLKVSLVTAGVRSDYTIALSIAAETVSGPWLVAGAQTLCAVSQEIVIPRAVSNTENDELLAWLTANPAPSYFPTDVDAVVITGDSIARSINIDPRALWWSSIMQETLCATRNINVFNGAQSGDTISLQRTSYPTTMRPFYSASRAKNIFLAPVLINNMRTGGQDGPTALAEYYSYLDLVKADGWLPIACTVLPTTLGLDTPIAYCNTRIRAEWAARGYAELADVAAIPGMADPSSTVIYQDGLHPTAAGNALMAPVYGGAVARVRG